MQLAHKVYGVGRALLVGGSLIFALAGCEAAPDQEISEVDDAVTQGCQPGLCYRDFDYDGKGAGALLYSCSCGSSGWSEQNGDCDDTHADRWQNLTCYDDDDGDHYGAGSSATVCAGLTCADGALNQAESAGDCDDTTSSVHPHRFEVTDNGVDDDCDGAPDGAMPLFYLQGNGNTSSSFKIKLKLYSSDERDAAYNGTLYGKVFYRKLENASSPYTESSITEAVISSVGLNWYAEFTVSGLEDLKVYEARVDLYYPAGYNPFTHSAIYGRIDPLSGCSGDANDDPPCSNSGVYYTITLPSGTNTPVKTARANVVLSALYEFSYFRTHPLGSWDDSLQYRYQLANRNTAYCSEFYANASQPYLLDMNPCTYVNNTSTPFCDPGDTGSEEDSIGDLKTWFSPFANAFVTFENDPNFAGIKPGDWLGVNPIATQPDGQHSQMFLAYDAAVDEYWFVEGNGSYSNPWGRMSHTSDVGSHSRCDDSAASGYGWYCPSNATSNGCSSGCYYIKSVGKVNNSNMLD